MRHKDLSGITRSHQRNIGFDVDTLNQRKMQHKRGGSVEVLARPSPDGHTSVEGIWVKVKGQSHWKDVLLGLGYRPPTSRNIY